MSRRKGRPGKREVKMQVPPMPICGTCPWRIWCKQLNFRTMPPAGGEPTKVCPIWWGIMNYMREKGIVPKGPPKDLSKAQAQNLYDALAKQRKEKLGMAS